MNAIKPQQPNENECYKFMRLTHILTLCLGLPFTRKKLNPKDEPNKDCDVAGYRYSFDKRMIPVWTAYLMLNSFITYYNYNRGIGYIGDSFKKCFAESYCFAVIELANRNIGPTVFLISAMFYGGKYKARSLAGTERTLRFLKETNGGVEYAKRHLPAFNKFYSLAIICLYSSCLMMYSVSSNPAVVVLFILNNMVMPAILSLAQFQYGVLQMGYRRINDLIENRSANDNPKFTKLLFVRLTDRYTELSQLVENVNKSYVPELLVRWPYTIARLVMIFLRITEYSSTLSGPHPIAAKLLTTEHVVEVMLFVFQNTYYCAVGTRLSNEAKRTLECLQKFKLRNEFKMDLEIKKTVRIFGIRASTHNVRASVGGFIITDMNFIRTVFTCVITYTLLLIQFRREKGRSKPLYHT
ncbi:uncharacterized protein LOC126834899 [Adelges cooleyi]|uniref:uncharacterized protein LOC126834899 n=1 Tax=Adelges cooleyi TaxID=133065 RepID=UPI00217F5C85|nr:uncharacterized protein LOC126834899 [Adelges cooleyi]